MKFKQMIKKSVIKNAYIRKEGVFSDTLFEHKKICLRISILIISNQNSILTCFNRPGLFTSAAFCLCSTALLVVFRCCYVRYSILHVGFRCLQPNHSPNHFYTSTHSDYYVQFIISKPHFSIPFADSL